MNAKELRQAADDIDGCSDGDFEKPALGGWETVADPQMCEKARQLAAHILATVRDDDDEPFDPAWAQAGLGENAVQVAGNLWLNKWAQIASLNSGLINTTVKTRGDFRTLCRLLGVELKELSTT